MRVRILVILMILMIAWSAASAYNVTQTKLIGVRELDKGEFRGVEADLTVEVHEGKGRVFVETKPLTQINTQAAARLSQEVACDVLDMDCSGFDFFYIIESDYQIIGGPSAGASMTAATIAALKGHEINSDVFITGTINPAGSIGPVGSIVEKAEASNELNAQLFLIPKGQEINYIEETDEQINITVLAEKNWDLEVIPVADIIEAYKYLTGYEINVKKVTSAEIASQKYNAVMKVLSDSLIDSSKEYYEKAQGKLNLSDIGTKEAELRENLKESKEKMDMASKSFEMNNFYSASSFSVRSMIDSYYTLFQTEYYGAEDNRSYIEDKLSKLDVRISSFETLFIKNRRIDELGDIEILAVVIDRAREAEDILEDAHEAYEENDMERALYLIAFAEVRKNTAHDWLTLISEFKGNLSYSFNPDDLREVSQERIQQTKTSIVYAQTVTENQILQAAENRLENAIDAFNDGKYIFAFFEASKARAEANLAMEARAVTNETVNDKIDELQEDAQIAIKKAEEKGLLPILALSYLEFGKTLRNQDPVQSLIFLSYSKEMARISEDLVKATIGEEWLPHPNIQVDKFYERSIKLDRVTQLMTNSSLIVTGLLAGLLVSFYIFEKK